MCGPQADPCEGYPGYSESAHGANAPKCRQYSVNDLAVTAFMATLSGAHYQTIHPYKLDYSKMAAEAYSAAKALWSFLPDKCKGY